jgi:acetate kinase
MRFNCAADRRILGHPIWASQVRILTVNAGSSSIRVALFRVVDEMSLEPVREGQFDGTEPTEAVLDLLMQQGCLDGVAAVGHRIVHGMQHAEPVLLDSALRDELRGYVPLAPVHLPPALAIVDAIARRSPRLSQVACFDTAFHHNLPRVAQLLPIPRRFEALGVRRYGFHGLSCEYLMAELERRAGTLAQGRVILAHLGNGASITAVAAGRSVDTSMGFTPNAGVPMGTRSGDLEPGLVGYLARAAGLDAEQFDAMMNWQAGLLGVAETSGDMHQLLALEATDPRAAEAIALFCHQVKKWIGAMAAVLGGIDALVFSGGIGEHAPVIRARICAGLEHLGIALSETANTRAAPVISAPTAAVPVHVIATDEQRVIAAATLRTLQRRDA